ncbi:MAG: SIS domain-containing protein [Defluviitaleaceae bacterium]|nr:SIS domain-containing protein [Defluviitaleaceae bacterium]
MFFGFDEASLRARNAFDTAAEILRQPETLFKTYTQTNGREEEIESFLNGTNERSKIILTGAGSSGYVGEALESALARKRRGIVSAHTTSIVESPEDYFSKDEPALLVSFARSGDSPESVACAALAERLSGGASHLIFTCNKEGGLYKKYSGKKNALAICMPEETNDKGFAMTSSVTSMMLSAYLALSGGKMSARQGDVHSLVSAVELFFAEKNERLIGLANGDYDRAAFIGAGLLRAVASEAALKLTELTDGKIASLSCGPMSFRHGPKAFINAGKPIVVVFLSEDKYTRMHEVDLLDELRREGREVFAVRGGLSFDRENLADDDYLMEIENRFADGFFLSILQLVFAQSLAFLFSYAGGFCVDDPVRSGTLSRVVGGVKIHPYVN